jgi:hypothetical protein
VTVAFQLLRVANVETLRHVVKFLCQPAAPNQVWSWDITKLLETVTYCAVSVVGNDSLSLASPVRRNARGQATEFVF